MQNGSNGSTSFWTKILTIIKSFREKRHSKRPNEDLFFALYKQVVEAPDMLTLNLLFIQVNELCLGNKLDIRDAMVLNQAAKLKNHEFALIQLQEIVYGGMDQVMMIELPPWYLSQTDVWMYHEQEMDKVRRGEIHKIKDIFKPQK